MEHGIWIKALAGCGFVFIGMMLAFGLVRLAANLVVLAVLVGACGFALHQVFLGEWPSWPIVVLGGLATGAAAGLLCLPVLPFSRFYRKK